MAVDQEQIGKGNMEERRADYFAKLNDISDRVARLETIQNFGSEGHKALSEQLVFLIKEVHALGIKINTLETQRNSVIAAAGILGGVVTFIGNWMFRIMTGGIK